MKRNKFLLYACLGLSLSSCSKALDINDNPNNPTESTPQLVFPQALVATARLVPTYNSYGTQLVGYRANGGGVSGWGSIISYNFTTTDFNSLWSTSYDILNDLQYVENTAKPQGQMDLYFAAKLLKVYNYVNLVDTYNDIPYSQALKGKASLTPAYDKATDIYKDLGTQLDSVVAYFKTSTSSTLFKNTDFLYKGDGIKWAQLGNTLKLKMLLRAKDKVQFTKTTLDDVGFVTADVIVNPGFTKNDGKQNPMWNAWAYSYDGAAVGAASQYAPTPYIMTFYNGTKISDAARANLIYKTGVSTPVNQLGYQQSDAGRGQAPSSWFLGTSSTSYTGKGILKGPAAGQPILLASESYFLQAEAALKGITSGTVATLFDEGIKASYNYLNRNEADATTVSAADLTAYLTNYKAENASNYLVNIASATSDVQKLQAIITQKYVAFNFLFGHEAWNEYRRTGYPSLINPNTNAYYPNNIANRNNTFVSITSEATATDKLPTRVMYPNTEFNYNSANIPSIDKYTSKIFWAR
ncbi:SusD/RagB family nutrient-binding outer membrane lipoprotein [Sphingobacterium multivorum]|uniref:SusD/RagB family nutrient-binding outer membrane lipoprotein n=1 Tax=Sphingobacterium multivorum TaxID=28454 RepID=UPI0028AFACAD|nr:SusD/RagB family nutrient-binding outer membrane lipoprotein [Sphingobacterium multivorum]